MAILTDNPLSMQLKKNLKSCMCMKTRVGATFKIFYFISQQFWNLKIFDKKKEKLNAGGLLTIKTIKSKLNGF